jgi:hypothetical protein
MTTHTHPRIIALAGPARSGKDTVADFLAEHHGAMRMAFADPIRHMIREGLNISDIWLHEAKDHAIPQLEITGRHLMQTLGTEWGRAIHPDIWVMALVNALKRHADHNDLIVITDTRFNNEACWVRRQPRGEVWHILRNDRPALTPEAQAHASEAGVAKDFKDLTIHNNSTLEALYLIVDSYMRATTEH